MSNLANSLVLGGIDFQIAIRGILVVTTAVAVLIGSIWLIVATNVGTRVGTLITLSGLFGWMAIMGIIWWIFGIGWVGASPSWHMVEVVRNGDMATSGLEKATELPNNPLGGTTTAYQFVVASKSAAAVKDYASPIPPDQLAGLTPEEAKARTADWELKNQIVTLSEVAAVDAPLVKAALADGRIDTGGWRLLSTAQAGEAVASATAMLNNEGIFDSPDRFKVLNSFDVGGKPKLPDDPGRWDRISTYIKNSVRLKHPTRYAVVQVQQVKDKATVVGEAPPRPEGDPTKSVISVVMERDLGNKRFKPAMMTVASLLLFAATTYTLHLRDKESMARRAAFAKKK